jgi:diguanylate cyclase (GGDEF)-like protein/PAS domain S-box-containing protein
MKKSKKAGKKKAVSLGDINDSVLLAALMENVADSIYFKDRARRLIWVSNKLVADLGYADAKMILGKTDEDLFGEEFGQKTAVDDLGVMESGKPIIGLVESRAMEDGSTNWTSTTKLPIHDKDGEVIGLLGITREINELKQVEQDLQYLATHDVLTSLPNRFLLFDAMEQAVKRAKRNKNMFAVLYIDLDGFKKINDEKGHHNGDRVLREIADRLSTSIRGVDRVARLGGDEFAVILEDMTELQDALKVAEKVREVVDKPFDFLPGSAGVTASIGIGLFPEHGTTAAALLRAADQAMYKAKDIGNSISVYSAPQIP